MLPVSRRLTWIAGMTLALGCLPLSGAAAPIGLTSWSSGASNNVCNNTFTPTAWTNPSSVEAFVESNNNCLSYFAGNLESLGQNIKLTIRLDSSGGDNDFVGLALGYNGGEVGSPSADYLVIDWSGNTGPGVPQGGLALVRVNGAVTSSLDLLLRSGPSSTEIARGLHSGTTAWSHDLDLFFDITFTSSHLTAFVNGNLEFDIDAPLGMPFSSGGLAFYNYSQAAVHYRDVTMVPVPEPSAAALLGLSLLGRLLHRRHI